MKKKIIFTILFIFLTNLLISAKVKVLLKIPGIT